MIRWGRLQSAAAGNWSQTFNYDGFGNLLTAPGTGEATQIVSGGSGGGVLDVDQHLRQSGTEVYEYDAAGLRVTRNPTGSNPGANEVTFWAGSQRMGVYHYEATGSGYGLTKWREWGTIGGRMVRPMDRLGSDLSAGRKYLPYGQEFGAVAPVATNSGYGSNTVRDGYRWGTYWRDEGGLDYAMQRYYAPGSGRFLSADPYQASAGPEDPGSWNRYAYVEGDPVNRFDPSGLDWWDPSTNTLYGDVDDQLLYALLMQGIQLQWRAAAAGADGGQTSDRGVSAEVAKYAVYVVSPTKSGTQYEAVKGAFASVPKNLDAECERFLSANGSARTYVDTFPAADLLAVGSFSSDKAAFTNLTGSNLPDGYAAIVFNTNSAFFNSNYTVDRGKLKGGTARARAFIVLHELGHATNAPGFLNDLNQKGVGESNDKLIEKNCAKTLSKF